MSADTRLKLGVALLILGLIMPAGTIAVAATNWPDSVKTIVGSILVLGFEIMLIPAVALMGKENYERIRDKAMGLLKATLMSGPAPHSRRRRPPGKPASFSGLRCFLHICSWSASTR